MALTPIRAEQVEKTQDLLRQMVKPQEVNIGNVEVATSLSGSTYFTYGMFQYEVPPVPYTIGLKLEEARLKLEKLADQAIKAEEADAVDLSLDLNIEMTELFDSVILMFKKLVRPVFLPHRLLWRWTSNPFQDASPSDVATLLHFFCACRMRSAIRLGARGSMQKLSRSRMIEQTT